jgi:hypothetical protein
MGASSWPAVPEDFTDGEDMWYVLDQSNLSKNVKLIYCVIEYFAQLLCFPEDNTGR